MAARRGPRGRGARRTLRLRRARQRPARRAEGRTVEVAGRRLLEPVRERAARAGGRRVRGSPAAGCDGDVAVLRVRAGAHAGAWPEVGRWSRSRGRVAPLGRVRRLPAAARRARGAIDATAAAARRARAAAGSRARSTPSAGAPSAASSAGCAAARRRCCAAWCSAQDERLADGGADRLPALRARAPARRQRAERDAARGCWCSPPRPVLGLPLRARLPLALALVAVYVPLAGGGPSIQRAGVMGAAGLSPRWRGGRRRAGTRSGSRPRRRSRSTRSRPASPAGSSRSPR